MMRWVDGLRRAKAQSCPFPTSLRHHMPRCLNYADMLARLIGGSVNWTFSFPTWHWLIITALNTVLGWLPGHWRIMAFATKGCHCLSELEQRTMTSVTTLLHVNPLPPFLFFRTRKNSKSHQGVFFPHKQTASSHFEFWKALAAALAGAKIKEKDKGIVKENSEAQTAICESDLMKNC